MYNEKTELKKFFKNSGSIDLLLWRARRRRGKKLTEDIVHRIVWVALITGCLIFWAGVIRVFADDHIVAKTIAAEACGEGEYGMSLVGMTIANRSRAWRRTPGQIVTQRGQYYGSTAANRDRLYDSCRAEADKIALNLNNIKDVTHGAIYFRRPDEKKKPWHKTETYRYKNHIFYK